MRFLYFLLYLAPFCATSFGAHWTIASWAMRTFPRLARWRRWLVVIAAVLVSLTPLARYAARTHRSPLASAASAVSVFELMLVVFAVLPLLLVRLVARIAARQSATPAPEAVEAPASIGRREAIERVGGVAVLGLTGGVFGWGMVRGRHAFEIEEVVVKIPGLPRVLNGYTIAQVSDIHTGVFVQERELAEGFDRVRELRPDLIVATGNLVDFDPTWAPLLARSLADLQARLRPRDGLTAIFGNHDYYTGVDAVRAALRDAGVDLLVNSGRLLRPRDGGGLALLGIDDLSARRNGGIGPKLDEAIGMVPPDVPRILLAHQPTFFPRAAGKVSLQLSGHTHGGQINPGFRPASFLFPYVSGRYEQSGSTLWVNRGFGVVGPPARIAAPPEVTKIVLVSA